MQLQGKETEPSQLVIQVIEKEVLPWLQDGAEKHLVMAEKRPQVLTIPALPGAVLKVNSSPIPRISKPGVLRDKWHKDSLLGFVYVIRGEADLLFSRRKVTCCAGDFVFFLPQTLRGFGAVSNWERPGTPQADSDSLWVFVKSEEVLCHVSWSRGEERVSSRHLFIPDNRLLSLAGLFHEEILRDEPQQATTQLLWLVYDRVRRKLREGKFLTNRVPARELPNKREKTESIGHRAQQYVDANLMERMTLDSVARAIYTSRSRLSREFQIQTGETFGAYLLRSRIERAKVLLLATSYNIKSIAWRAGFTDPDYFSAAFRRVVGLTPTEFRKKIR